MAEKRDRINVNPFAELIVKKALKIIFKKLFNVKLNMPDEVRNLKPPFVLLPNHQGFWDPFLAGVYFKPPVYYITSDAVFRSRLFGFLLKFLGAIPKTKSQSDLDALKNIFAIKEQGRCIGIFPEGQRNWDGRTLPLIKSTSKLIRMLKIPVVSAVFKGGYYSQPRWGTSINKGEMVIEYKILFNGDEVGNMKVTEIHNKLTEALTHDEIEYQKSQQIEWTGGKYAENIEQLLFVCPECGEMKGFTSGGDRFSCKACGRKWQITKFQEITVPGGSSLFDNVRDWDAWQLNKLYERIDEIFDSGGTIFDTDSVTLHTGFKSSRPKPLGPGMIKLTSESFILFDKNGNELKNAPISEITGINVQNREVLDLYHDGKLYMIRDNKHHFNAYSWWRAVDYIQREKLKMNLPD